MLEILAFVIFLIIIVLSYVWEKVSCTPRYIKGGSSSKPNKDEFNIPDVNIKITVKK